MYLTWLLLGFFVIYGVWYVSLINDLMIQVTYDRGSTSVLYQRTNNISSSSFTSAKKSSLKARSVLDCGSKCIYFESSGEGVCNAYSFNDETDSCELASLTFLEVCVPVHLK